MWSLIQNTLKLKVSKKILRLRMEAAGSNKSEPQKAFTLLEKKGSRRARKTA